jgi:hypothetical protein
LPSPPTSSSIEETTKEELQHGKREMEAIVRMMAVYNEMDVLPQNIAWYAPHGIRTVVVDNGSVDGSYEYCREALSRGDIARLERLPTEEFEWLTLLRRLHDLARELRPYWLMLTAPDEFFEPADGEDLGVALREDFRSGYNLIKFFNMEFWMTERDDPTDPDPLTRMRHYSCYDVDMYRAYPNLEGLDIVSRFGHRPLFPAGVAERPSPRRYVSRHYKLRNLEQAQRKIERIRPNDKEPHLHSHYSRFTGPEDFVVSARLLHRYDFDHRWSFESVYDGNRGEPRETRSSTQAG